ncbi:DUF6193 family natural product biosynthesis protein [Streptomyces wuyuanensis]|uniref:DUF6193 family natural product biosynthesis protein n=1 Tax=Streptomyces wuyuanensis TaxID=1196353 RepID=UPI0038231349
MPGAPAGSGSLRRRARGHRAETDPLGSTTHREYDRYDRLLSRRDVLGRTTTFSGASDTGVLSEVATVEEAFALVAVNLPEGCGPAIIGKANDL